MVMLSFRIFDLEADSQCRYDYLDVYNGHSNLVQKLGRFCGTFRPGALISTTNTMMLNMVTDAETQGRGFVAYFSGTKPYVDGMWSHFLFLFIYFEAQKYTLITDSSAYLKNTLEPLRTTHGLESIHSIKMEEIRAAQK